MGIQKSARAVKSKAISFNPSKLLAVVVGKGPNQQRFSIHEDVICGRSEFFRRAMTGNWIENKERLVKLPEDNADNFNVYVNLIYSGLIHTQEAEHPRTVKEIRKEFHNLAKLYVLAEKLQDSKAKDATIHAILTLGDEKDADGEKWVPSPDCVIIIYNGTVKGSLGRKLMVDYEMGADSIQVGTTERLDECPKDFLVDLADGLLKSRSNVYMDFVNSDWSVYMEEKKEQGQ